jgi:hypothetical protein
MFKKPFPFKREEKLFSLKYYNFGRVVRATRRQRNLAKACAALAARANATH